ncbi:unnamed protein product [Fusarium venenatum]|uniref:Uncharacterized protein n=1 Tax=Fusarium venenatum TaxID=56646 RepID=A0A2L2TBC2_9HYPO|nr:uncharacterized protein FVRRES_04672 [Fusarium venenatum]CEI60236.1 unnamed protein product [Fusarium venenatum]
MLSVESAIAVGAHIPSTKYFPKGKVINVRQAYEYDYIIFYRWLSPDLYERGRVMARLVAEMIQKSSRRIWLDQHQIIRSAEPKEVTKRIAQTFLTVSQIIILAAPGDWDRFSNMDDIHRWEWEMSLRSGEYMLTITSSKLILTTSDKQVWLLQYGMSENDQPPSKEQLAAGMEAHCPKLAKLFMSKDVHIRSLSMDSIDTVVSEISETR